jgi:hypothetical protein
MKSKVADRRIQTLESGRGREHSRVRLGAEQRENVMVGKLKKISPDFPNGVCPSENSLF